MLEKQLDCMRKMVSSAEQERSQALKRSLLIEKQRQDSDICDLRHQLDKISDLEREHLRLTATQTLAEVCPFNSLTPLCICNNSLPSSS